LPHALPRALRRSFSTVAFLLPTGTIVDQLAWVVVAAAVAIATSTLVAQHVLNVHAGHAQRRKDAEPTISDMVTFTDPKGTMMEVFKRDAFSGQRFPSKGIVPHKLGHVAFFVSDVKRTTDFYCDVLGFRVSDWMGDFFSFLRCGRDHHTINLMQTNEDRHFHTAFELRDWAHLQTACDYLSLNGYKLIWGPGRHGIGHNLFAYHRAPNGLITELFAELDQVNEELGYFEPRPWHRDNPQRPKVWAKDPSASNLWGIMPPDEMHK